MSIVNLGEYKEAKVAIIELNECLMHMKAMYGVLMEFQKHPSIESLLKDLEDAEVRIKFNINFYEEVIRGSTK